MEEASHGESTLAMNGRPSVNKRNREQQRREYQQDKAADRAARAEARKLRSTSDEEDPDIAHIVPGPQPPSSDF
jgi:hypothetical protein